MECECKIIAPSGDNEIEYCARHSANWMLVGQLETQAKYYKNMAELLHKDYWELVKLRLKGDGGPV